VRITKGIPPRDRAAATALYWEAFGAKLGRVMGPSHKAQEFVERVLDPTHAICAHDGNGILLGVAGFKTVDGALVGGDFADMAAIYGRFGALWRGLLLNLLERDTENQRFLMDGIFVAPGARGQGVGSALLDAVAAEAAARGFAEVRLDVVDTNPRARALYERQGFQAVSTHRMGPLRLLYGFRSATTMVRTVT
jgi:ribosomal protein S18 acetylase RimI-like enzyme